MPDPSSSFANELETAVAVWILIGILFGVPSIVLFLLIYFLVL